MKALGSQRAAIQVIANVPLAAFGAIVALLIVNRPSFAELAEHTWYTWPVVWIQSTHLSLAHWVGFITLIGIVSRNGIMMISHYQHLMEVEGMPFGKEMIIRGSLERLAPVMMTAMTSFIGLIPLLFGYGEPGKRFSIHYPSSSSWHARINHPRPSRYPPLFLLFGKPKSIRGGTHESSR